MKNILFFISLIFSLVSFANNKIPNLSELSLQECTLQKVISILDLESSIRQASVAKNLISTNNEIKQLTAKLPNNNIPLSKQLSSEDLNKFSIDSQEIRAMETRNLVESRYERDLMVIEKLTETADDFYRWDRVPADNDPNAIYFALLLAMSEKLPASTPKLNTSEKCDLDYALFSLEKEPMLKLDNMTKDVESAVNRIDQIYAKYNMNRGNFNFEKLNGEDKDEITSIANKVINPAKNEQNYIQKLENIRYYAKISSLVYNSSLKDILDSGGDPSRIGDTVDAEIKNGDLTKIDATMVSFWGVIEDKIPPEWLVEMEKEDKMLAAPGKATK